MVSISYAFRLGKTTISNIINETCKVLWDVLCPNVFKGPSEGNWLKYAEEFENLWHLPHCIAAIDGKHIPMQVRIQFQYLYNYIIHF